MGDLIDFQDRWNKQNGPDPEFVFRDDKGVYWYMFACTYQYAGEEWCLHVWARDMEDAKGRLQAIHDNCKVDGQIQSRVEA